MCVCVCVCACVARALARVRACVRQSEFVCVLDDSTVSSREIETVGEKMQPEFLKVRFLNGRNVLYVSECVCGLRPVKTWGVGLQVQDVYKST